MMNTLATTPKATFENPNEKGSVKSKDEAI